MSDSKRATLITVGATKNEKTKVNKTVRLTINLVESNESKYPELNYKELVIAEECKNRVENGKTDGLHPFSDNDDDVERVARKFEQKYGGKSTYGRKGRSKRDDFADIGAGYDENDSFIDNTDGYDEMIPPECDTLYGGFYINSGSLEFKNVDRSHSDEEPRGRRNKRRLSSSSSEEESSSSSSGMESADDKQPPRLNGDALHTEHRKKKNKKHEKKKAKKIRRTDSSAATSGKQTSDDNNHGDAESDSRTSQSDSLTSKPAPSSENPITSDSSRDVDGKLEVALPPEVVSAIQELEAAASVHFIDKHYMSSKEIEAKLEPFILRLERTMSSHKVSSTGVRACWTRAARAMRCPRALLLQRAGLSAPAASAAPAAPTAHADANDASTTTPSAAVSVIQSARCEVSATNSTTNPTTNSTTSTTAHKRSKTHGEADDYSSLTEDEREAKIVETLQRLKALIEERKPGMMANYNAECERVQEERKKIQIASAADGAPHIEKRLPKRRFPWCPRSRDLLARLVRLANAGGGGGGGGGGSGGSGGEGGGGSPAASLLARRALPLFPAGFVRMPTLLRQADLSKELKANEMKRQRLGSSSQPLPIMPPMQFPEAIQFPSSLTVTTMKTSPDKDQILDEKEKLKAASIFGSIINSFSLAKDIVDKHDDRKKDSLEKKDDLYIPPNNIGSITITPVPSSQQKDKKVNNTLADKQKEGLIRIKSPAALNEMVHKQEKVKALENIHKREKDKLKKDKLHNQNHSVQNKINELLHIDTSYPVRPKETTPSPKSKEEVTQKHIENLRISENNIPRPGLVPVHLSPTFAKPDKRPPEVKKKKEIVIVSDLDPLGDIQSEPLSVDDSSSDVEVVEDNKCVSESDSVPSKDKVSVRENHKDLHKDGEKRSDKLDDATKEEFDSVMKNLRDLEQRSQESPKFNSSSYGGVITSAKRDKSSNQKYNSRSTIFGDTRSDKDKLTSFFEQNGWM